VRGRVVGLAAQDAGSRGPEPQPAKSSAAAGLGGAALHNEDGPQWAHPLGKSNQCGCLSFPRHSAPLLEAEGRDRHKAWSKDIQETQGHAVRYPIIGDADLTVAKLYDMIHPNAIPGKRSAAENATVRAVFVIGPDKKVKATFAYPMSTGRNFDEVLRLLDSVQLTARHTVATPVNWKPGDDVIIPASVSDEDARKKYPKGFRTIKPYLRTVAQPE
jgi:hypothetical protein